jgi:alkylation response protein AidB-like acyl-CoA dehydrogenase
MTVTEREPLAEREALTDPETSDEERMVVELVEKLLAEHDPSSTPVFDFLGARFDAGLAWVWFPKGYGGLGLAPQMQAPVERLLRAAGAPSMAERNVIGYGMGAPTVLTHGTEEQKKRLLRPLFTGEEIWCQLFSEPGAGSDVAGLATSAVRDGDEWIMNGQKVWTTLAHLARWGMILARTDPNVPKHQGLTYFVVDMHAPGVEVRPLRQMTGHAEFNEVFFADVRIPDSMRLDAVGAGWRVATTTLMNERVALGGGVPARESGPIHQAVTLWKEKDGPKSPAHRERLLRLWIDAEVSRITNLRARQLRRAGTPGPEGSVAKLIGAELNKRIYDLCVDIMGMEATLYPAGYEMVRPEKASLFGGGDPRVAFLRSRANSIEGGTSEIMRNILGERVLGLPGEPRSDKNIPWAQVPRS